MLGDRRSERVIVPNISLIAIVRLSLVGGESMPINGASETALDQGLTSVKCSVKLCEMATFALESVQSPS